MKNFFPSIIRKLSNPYYHHPLSIVVVSKSNYFSELANDIVRFLNDHNNYAILTDKFPSDFYEVYIVINPLFQFKNRFKKNKNSLYVCLQTEQLNTPTQKGFKMLHSRITEPFLKKILLRYDSVFEFSLENLLYLKTLIKNVRHINYGYDEKYDYSELKRDKYEIVFIGDSSGVDNRREQILDSLKSQYNFSPENQNIWGKEKYQTISDSKIALNIHFDHSSVFESFRFFEYLSQKTFLISEYTINSYPFVDGVDYISLYHEDFSQKIDFYLKNEDERKKIAENGYRTAKRFTRQNSLGFLLHSIEIDLADRLILKTRYRFAYSLIINLSTLKSRFL